MKSLELCLAGGLQQRVEVIMVLRLRQYCKCPREWKATIKMIDMFYKVDFHCQPSKYDSLIIL